MGGHKVDKKFVVRAEVTEIHLTSHVYGHKICLIDTEDLPKLEGYTLTLTYSKHRDTYIAYIAKGPATNRFIVKLHRFLLGAPKDKQVDHKNCNTLDNRKANLRLCSQKENSENRDGASKVSKSGVRGVFPHRGKWKAAIHSSGKTIHLGVFATVGEAEIVLTAWRKENMPFSEMDKEVI